MNKDELEQTYWVALSISTCLTFLISYFCFPLFMIGAIPAIGFAALIIFRIDDDSDRGDDKEIPEPEPDSGLALDFPKDDGLKIKRVGNLDFNKKNLQDYDYSKN